MTLNTQLGKALPPVPAQFNNLSFQGSAIKLTKLLIVNAENQLHARQHRFRKKLRGQLTIATANGLPKQSFDVLFHLYRFARQVNDAAHEFFKAINAQHQFHCAPLVNFPNCQERVEQVALLSLNELVSGVALNDQREGFAIVAGAIKLGVVSQPLRLAAQ